MRNDEMKKTTSMTRNGGEDESRGGMCSSDVTADPNQNTALNRITNGHCLACDQDVDTLEQGIQCWFCGDYFHAINCDDNLCVAAATVFKNHIKAAVSKSGVYERRFGRFLFSCDYCMTLEEEKRCASSVDRIDLLDKKMNDMNNTFISELSSLKNLITRSSSTVSTHVTPSESETSANPWNDQQRTDNLKHTMSISKDSNGNAVDMKQMEKICVDNGISVHRTFSLQKSESTGIVLNSKSDAELLKQKLCNDMPLHKVEQVAAKMPVITVVGLQREYTKEDVISMVKKQNPGINSLFEAITTSPQDQTMSVLAIKPLKNNPEIFKAIIRVSNVIRSVISKQGDRLFIGFQSSCKVYDHFFVLRCFKCQEYNHHSKDCKGSAVCGFCSGNHETRNCTEKSYAHRACCTNCTKSGKTRDVASHEAGSLDCPIFQQNQSKIKNSIPFHQ